MLNRWREAELQYAGPLQSPLIHEIPIILYRMLALSSRVCLPTTSVS
jgi:hypothetical protein